MAYIKDGEYTLYEFSGILKNETELAYLVDHGGGEAWLPKSKTERDGNNWLIPEWLAIEKGIA